MILYQTLLAAIKAGSPSKVVYDSSIHFLGSYWWYFCSIRCSCSSYYIRRYSVPCGTSCYCRILPFRTKTLAKRLIIAVPLFVVGFIVSKWISLSYGVTSLGRTKLLRWLCYGLQQRTYTVIINSTGYVQSLRHLSVPYVYLPCIQQNRFWFRLSIICLYRLRLNSTLFSIILHTA